MNFLDRLFSKQAIKQATGRQRYRELVRQASDTGDLPDKLAAELERIAADLGIPPAKIATDIALIVQHRKAKADLARYQATADAAAKSEPAALAYAEETQRIIQGRTTKLNELCRHITQAQAESGLFSSAEGRLQEIEQDHALLVGTVAEPIKLHILGFRYPEPVEQAEIVNKQFGGPLIEPDRTKYKSDDEYNLAVLEHSLADESRRNARSLAAQILPEYPADAGAEVKPLHFVTDQRPCLAIYALQRAAAQPEENFRQIVMQIAAAYEGEADKLPENFTELLHKAAANV